MINSWFTVKVKYTKQFQNGTLKRVSEPYLLGALSFTDAEARIYEELGTRIRGEFHILGITRTEIQDIFAYDDTGIWYKCKISYLVENDENEKQKKISQQFLVEADSIKEAYERLKESLSSMGVDFEIPSILLSPIIDIFPNDETRSKIIEEESNEIEA
tara:strand:+ start:2556 stop:3032 length:477 start_codon:yes stop_codon:yes gene_type:complete